jgi:iron complex transport system permease protein
MSVMALANSGTVVAGDRTRRAIITTIVLCIALFLSIVISLHSGPTGVGIGQLFTYLTGSGQALSQQEQLILEAVRLPRTGLGILIGAALAVSGAMMQGLFRNPLADPGLVGVTSGAALFAIAALAFGSTALAGLTAIFGMFFLPLMAFLGGLLNTWLLYVIATRQGFTSTTVLVLAGIAIAAMTGALTGLIFFVADDRALRDITFWSLGSLGGATAAKFYATLPFALAICLVIPFVARGLDALVLGDAAAFHMGIPVQKLKRIVIIVVAAACGASVAAAGSIGFVGIVVPHLLRLIIGASHRFLLPCSAIGGAALLLLADSFARTIVAPAELPIGVVTALIGAPIFLFLLLGKVSGSSMRNS